MSTQRPVIVVAEVSVTVRREGGHTVVSERKELRYPADATELSAAEAAIADATATVLGRFQ